MNQLPLVLENIINDYKTQMELFEHQEKFKPTIELLKENIILYMNPEDMKTMWGGRTIFHGSIISQKSRRTGKHKRWCRNMEYRNWVDNFEQCERRIICADCGMNTNIGNYKQETYPNAMSCFNEIEDCEKWYCGCNEDREDCDCMGEDYFDELEKYQNFMKQSDSESDSDLDLEENQ